MGMAASQARYLGLTARKTNVEYEGQQINQARVALANQSANTFNQLLALEVPTAPSKTEFTTLQYSFVDGTYGETITNMSQLLNDPDGYNYMVTHHHYADVYTGVETKRTNPQVVMGSVATSGPGTGTITTTTTVGGDTLYHSDGQSYQKYNPTDHLHVNMWNQIVEANSPALDGVDPNDVYLMRDSTDNLYHFALKSDLDASVGGNLATEYVVQPDPSTPIRVGNYELTQYDPNDVDLKAAYEQIIRDWPDSAFAASDPTSVYTWKDGSGKTYFACAEDLILSASSAVDPERISENQVNRLMQYNAQDVRTKIEKTERAFVDLDGSGRPQSIKFEDSSAVFQLSTETITDDVAYNDAMNEYNYQVQLYEKAIEDINAKTKRIQEQDRTLELRLRQLDTEQDALQTEMEAVKKVIEKNIESTFKTFE